MAEIREVLYEEPVFIFGTMKYWLVKKGEMLSRDFLHALLGRGPRVSVGGVAHTTWWFVNSSIAEWRE